jgi:hypothetical protein
LKTAVISSHIGDSAGFEYNGYRGSELALPIARRVSGLIKADFCCTEPEFNDPLKKVEFLRNMGYSTVLDLQFATAVDHKAGGHYSVIYPGSTEGRKLAQAIGKALHDKINIPLHGIREEINNINSFEPIVLIVKCMFLDNPNDLKYLHIENLAQAIAAGFNNYLSGLDKGYREIHNGYAVSVNPMNLKISYERRAVSYIAKEKFINGAYFNSQGRAFHSLISEEAYLERRKIWNLGKKCGTFIVRTDGSVETGTLAYTGSASGISFLIEGFNLDYEANGSSSLMESVIREGHAGDANAAAALLRKTWRTGIGWNGKEAVLITAYATGDELRKLMRAEKCLDRNSNTVGLGLDGGSQAAFKYNKVLVGGSSYQNNIIYF